MEEAVRLLHAGAGGVRVRAARAGGDVQPAQRAAHCLDALADAAAAPAAAAAARRLELHEQFVREGLEAVAREGVKDGAPQLLLGPPVERGEPPARHLLPLLLLHVDL